ncbi:hypothetical protein PROFUN_12333 [Planoprotostelium fungivorum]|uniref:Calcium uniporter protein n=1 Tax=Planoprotostelium fungivorum TaxID=1890364 RepID=A0A2P6N9F1_9EUKA|nr:hypothetical protein PROFUN_12333 [Planoprotostelium fungivorum]
MFRKSIPAIRSFRIIPIKVGLQTNNTFSLRYPIRTYSAETEKIPVRASGDRASRVYKLTVPLGEGPVLFSPKGNETLRELISDIKSEGAGVNAVTFYESDGSRLSASSRIDEAFNGNELKLVIDGKNYMLSSPSTTSGENGTAANQQHADADAFYQSVLAAGTPGTPIPAQMIPSSPQEISKLEREIFPLMREKLDLDRRAYRFADLVLFGGLGAFAAQYFFLARLTWWEFNWDIMEPVTYFIGSGTALLAMFYFTLAKQEYSFENVRDGIARKRMAVTYWKSRKMDVERYFDLEYELKARDPEALLRLESYITGHTPIPSELRTSLEKAK